MAQADHARHIARLRISSDNDSSLNVENNPPQTGPPGAFQPTRPSYRSSVASQETLRATPPMNIPTPHEDVILVDGEPIETSYIDHYMRTRQPSVSFDNEVKLDSGHRQSIDEPLQKPAKLRPRGRSLLQAMSDDMSRSARAHSESDRSQYDPVTGRHLPRYSTTPPREEPHIGEGRFPLLQSTVDEMARESQASLPQILSMTSESTMSPNDEIRTPQDEEGYLSSPPPVSPLAGSAFSFEEPREFKRTASQRWREGQNSQSAQDFFARVSGSRRQSRTQLAGRPSRQDTSGSTRSPRSAASSYLRAFSMSSSNGADNPDNGPPACDAEGQTIGEDYVLGKQIGYGGFSTIKEVTQLSAGHRPRKLAVKIVKRNIGGKSEAENEQVQAEFEHEVELWRFLNHRNILPLEAVYKLEEATFCFIPLNTGGTLFDLVRTNRKGVPRELAKSYLYQLASALRYLHLDARVVHRDVKLENCLIDPPTTPDGPSLLRLCDFGMAEWLSNDNSSGPPSPNINATDRPPLKHIGPADTSTSAFAGGSLEYAAPEILRIAEASSTHPDDSTVPAERSIVSPAVDIWAFGVCVYSLLVGSRPFQNAFQPRVVMAILAGDWDRQKLLERGGEQALELVEACLEMEEVNRWSISDVVRCEWLADLAAMEEENEENNATGGGIAGGGWRL